MTDPYLFTPDGKKIRSSVELLAYIKLNPEHWETFDAYEINVEKSKVVKLQAVRKVKNNVDNGGPRR